MGKCFRMVLMVGSKIHGQPAYLMSEVQNQTEIDEPDARAGKPR